MDHFDSNRENYLRVLGVLAERIEHAIHLIHHMSSAIADFAAKQQAFNDAQSKAIDDISSEIQSLNNQIAALQNSSGQISPGDQTLLDNIQTSSQAITSKLQALDTLQSSPPVVPTSLPNPNTPNTPATPATS